MTAEWVLDWDFQTSRISEHVAVQASSPRGNRAHVYKLVHENKSKVIIINSPTLGEFQSLVVNLVRELSKDRNL